MSLVDPVLLGAGSGWIAFAILAAWAIWKRRASPEEVIAVADRAWEALPAEARADLEGRVKAWLAED